METRAGRLPANLQAVIAEAYGRVVVRSNLPDGRDLSAEVVKQCLAIEWLKLAGGVYRNLEVPDVLKNLWLTDTLACIPDYKINRVDDLLPWKTAP